MENKEMTIYSTIEDIKSNLDKIYKAGVIIQQETKNQQEKKYNEGYIKGIKDALGMITKYIEQNKLSDPLVSKEVDTNRDLPPKLFHFAPEEILKFDFSKAPHNNYLLDELAETAFRLENQLLELLGDANSMPFDSYSALNSKQLLDIIRTSAEGICRLVKK